MATGELGEGEEQSGISLMANEQSSIVAQPGNGSFDFPSLAVALEHTSVLSVMPLSSALAMWRDELNAIAGQSITQGIGVGGTVINQSWSVLVKDMIIEQRFDQPHFSRAGAVEIDPQRQAVAINQQHQLATFATLSGANTFAPFFAGTNVASAIATFQSTRPFRSSLCSTRRHASSKMPLSIHSHSRRQQVV